MQRLMLKSKLHRVRVTEADLNYEGSLTIDASLMRAAGILPFEMVRVYNINNGERFETYAIEGLPDSGVICLNGAAARKGVVGDLLIVATYALYSEDELAGYRPRLVHVDKDNRIV
ncbi:MAG TPA: aspartate 1-decarboxylase [Proteobacteria bacterium]|nr:aspartate 1-decarboxylase [Pseudomonadota bacterium]